MVLKAFQKPVHFPVKFLQALICNKMIPLEDRQTGIRDIFRNFSRVVFPDHVFCPADYEGRCGNLCKLFRVNYPLSKANGLPASQTSFLRSTPVGAEQTSTGCFAPYYLHRR